MQKIKSLAAVFLALFILAAIPTQDTQQPAARICKHD